MLRENASLFAQLDAERTRADSAQLTACTKENKDLTAERDSLASSLAAEQTQCQTLIALSGRSKTSANSAERSVLQTVWHEVRQAERNDLNQELSAATNALPDVADQFQTGKSKTVVLDSHTVPGKSDAELTAQFDAEKAGMEDFADELDRAQAQGETLGVELDAGKEISASLQAQIELEAECCRKPKEQSETDAREADDEFRAESNGIRSARRPMSIIDDPSSWSAAHHLDLEPENIDGISSWGDEDPSCDLIYPASPTSLLLPTISVLPASPEYHQLQFPITGRRADELVETRAGSSDDQIKGTKRQRSDSNCSLSTKQSMENTLLEFGTNDLRKRQRRVSSPTAY